MPTERPKIPDALKDILIPSEPDSTPLTLPGKCPIHGEVNFARFVLHAQGKIISEHCAKCLSIIFKTLVGELEYDDEE